jgi:hypothetical protein
MVESTDSSEQLVPLIKATLALDAFSSDWKHCDQTANYLAQFVSADRPDPSVFSNLLSTVLNEILEVVYGHHPGVGAALVAISALGQEIHIELTLPVDEATRQFYAEALEPLSREDPMTLYQRELERLYSGPPHPAMGLYELAADYGAKVEKKEADPSTLMISVRLSISSGED